MSKKNEKNEKNEMNNKDEANKICRTLKELANAMKNEVDEIIIEGDLKRHVLRIKATGKVAWGVCAASLAVAIASICVAGPAAIAPPASGMALAAGLTAGGAAAVTLGTAIGPAIAIGVCAGGVGALNTLRDKYKIVEENDQYITLKRK